MLARTPLLTGLACGVLALTPGPSVAQGTQSSLDAGLVRAGANASMTIAFPGAASECQLTASTAGRPAVTLSRIRPTGSRVTWLWRVPARAQNATWQLLATCGASQLDGAVHIQGRAHGGTLSLARGVSVLQYARAAVHPDASSVVRAAHSWWASNSSSILTGFHTGRSTGECTAYIAARRPDIIERVDIWAYSRFLLAGHGALNVNWDAKYWARNARRAGMATGKTPRVGAVLVFQAGAYGATALGHVAYVTSVSPSGAFTISEMHAPVRGRVTTRHFGAATARAMAADPGIDFIYR